MAPGSFQQSDFKTNESSAVQFLFGTSMNENLRFDVSYTHYFDISMTMDSKGPIPLDPLVTGHTGGYRFSTSNDTPSISSNAMLLSAYYNFLDSLVGRLKLRPYVGAGIGMASNTISDYVVYDAGAYIIPSLLGTTPSVGTVVGLTDLYARHKGGTVTNFAYAFELGITANLTNRVVLDIFGRWMNLGDVESNGIVVTHGNLVGGGTVVTPGTGHGSYSGTSDSYFPEWGESGTLSVLDIGARLRWMF
jgi:opacity protein-like surface antigen